MAMSRARAPASLVFVVSLAGSFFPENTTADMIDGSKFMLIDEKVIDAPVGTQVKQYIVAASPPSKDELQADLIERFHALKGLTGYRFHKHPTAVGVYIYASEEKARTQKDNWIAMLFKCCLDTDKSEPEPIVDDDRLAALMETPIEAFGLSEDLRKRIFKETYAAGQRAYNEATKEVPASSTNENGMSFSQLYSQLNVRYRAKVAEQYALSDEELLEIYTEGQTEGWSKQ